MNIQGRLTNFDEGLQYLLDENTYNELISLEEFSPLLSYRARSLKSSLFNNSEKRGEYLKKHKHNLERHLVRMYRLRNELIHDAGLFENIENLTGNIRYYLLFIINKLIEYFCDCEEKPDNEKKLSMNDFFHYQELIWNNLAKRGYDVGMLIKVPHPVDLI